MIYIMIYSGFVFMFLFIDALLCISIKVKFVLWKSLLSSILFPITAPFLILSAQSLTINYKDEIDEA